MCYRGSKFHKVIKLCHAQGGDIVNFNGTSGCSIYGKHFKDENFILKVRFVYSFIIRLSNSSLISQHDPGVISMANFGKPDTNNSQFFITTIECLHFDDTNVVFGQVLKGLCVVGEMEKYANDDGHPVKSIVIANCGQIKSGESWAYCDDDVTADKLPPFPADWEQFNEEFTIKEKLAVLNVIKESGNYFYRTDDFVKSARKYKKLTRYYNFFKDHSIDEDDIKSLDSFQIVNLTNLAATELKLEEFNDVRFSCNAAVKIDPKNFKAFYRRGVANLELKNYELAIDDLKMAHELLPGNRAVLEQFYRAKKYLLEYRMVEKLRYRKMFQ